MVEYKYSNYSNLGKALISFFFFSFFPDPLLDIDCVADVSPPPGRVRQRRWSRFEGLSTFSHYLVGTLTRSAAVRALEAWEAAPPLKNLASELPPQATIGRKLGWVLKALSQGAILPKELN